MKTDEVPIVTMFIKILFYLLALFFIAPNLSAQSQWQMSGEITVKGLNSGANLSRFGASSSGIIYAIDSEGNKLLKISSKGEVLNWIGGFGWSDEQFDLPSDIWVTGLDIFVADQNNHRIQRYDIELNFISSLEGVSEETGNIDFEYPGAVAQSRRGDVYVADSENGQVLKYSAEGEFLLQFGGLGYGEGRLVEPISIGITGDETVIVADRERNLILSFDEFGNYIDSAGEGMFADILAVTTTKSNQIAVLDGDTKLIYLFSENMNEYSVIDLSILSDRSVHPTDITMVDNKMLILDSDSKTLLQFEKR